MIETTQTTWAFNLSVAHGEESNTWGPVFTSEAGMSDELAIEFARKFVALPWPAGVTATAAITRRATDTTQTEANLAAGAFV